MQLISVEEMPLQRISEGDTGKNLHLKNKRVGMVVFSPYPADPRPRRAASALLQEGMHVDLICEGNGKSPSQEVLGELEVIRIPIRRRRGGFLDYAYQYALFISVATAILARRCFQKKYDLVYVHNMPDILVMCGLIPKLFGAKMILDQHDPMAELMMTIFGMNRDSFGVRLMLWLEKWSIARVNLVITVSSTFKRIFSGRSCSDEKIGVVMNSPDERLFPFREAGSYPVRQPEQPFVIMYHGLLENRNGLHLAVEAFAKLRTTIANAELRIYGYSTSYLEQVMSKVHELGLSDSVHYLGPKRLEELAQEIESCDVGIIPNPRNEFTQINTPTRIFEYLALGKPVVAPRTTGIEDYFASDSLFFFEPGSVQDLAAMLEHIALNNKDAIATAKRGQQVYLAHRWTNERQSLVGLVVDLLSPDRKVAV